MNFIKRSNRTGDKYFFYYDFGRSAGMRPTTGVFIYAKPKNQIQKNHNKEALSLLEVKKSELILDRQALGTSFIPTHKLKANFLDFYATYVKNNKRKGNRHLENSLTHFKIFIGKDFIGPIDVTEDLCVRFRRYLLTKFMGDTPSNYFSRFKQMVKGAMKSGYFKTNPADSVKAKSNPSINIKENLEVEEYLALLRTPCFNQEVQEAFIFSCYTGLRYVDVKHLQWPQINGKLLNTRIIQRKTGKELVIELHHIARAILIKRQKAINDLSGKVFHLPTNNGCNKVLQQWVQNAGIQKHITWHCARLSFSILLQDRNVDTATVALLLGHTSTKYVDQRYKRHRPKDASSSINQLPAPDATPYFLTV
jgi:integrase